MSNNNLPVGEDPLLQPLLLQEEVIMDEEEQQPLKETLTLTRVSDDDAADIVDDHNVHHDQPFGENDVTVESSVADRDSWWIHALHKPLIPDVEWAIRDVPLLEGTFTVKLLKFIGFTFVCIAFVHWFLVSLKVTDRDQSLKLWQIWVFDGNLITSDCLVFFVVGRLWKQRGIDHLAWIGMAALANIYFESQQYFKFLEHSFTLYEMHCCTF